MAKRRIDADNCLTERLAGLRVAVAGGGATLEALRPALADHNYRLVAAAAEYARDGLLYPLEPDLIAAFWLASY